MREKIVGGGDDRPSTQPKEKSNQTNKEGHSKRLEEHSKLEDYDPRAIYWLMLREWGDFCLYCPCERCHDTGRPSAAMRMTLEKHQILQVQTHPKQVLPELI